MLPFLACGCSLSLAVPRPDVSPEAPLLKVQTRQSQDLPDLHPAHSLHF